MTDAQLEIPFPELSLETLEEIAIMTLREFQPEDRPYYGCFSGGKDSCVIKELARRASVNVQWHYNVTTIDPPELVRFIQREHPDVVCHRPQKNFFKRMEEKGFPTRRGRWCCDEYKERKDIRDERLIMGVRAEESPKRAAMWKTVQFHTRTHNTIISPILRWRDEDVWGFLKDNDIPYCGIYDEGFKRLGCIGCPMAVKAGRLREFARWPKYEALWKRAFQRLWDRRKGDIQRNGEQWFGERKFSSWQEMWEWWLNDEPLPQEECQGVIDLFG